MSDFNLLIDGKMVPGDHHNARSQSRHRRVVAQCPRASKAQLDTGRGRGESRLPSLGRDPDRGAPQARHQDGRRHRSQRPRARAPPHQPNKASRWATPPAKCSACRLLPLSRLARAADAGDRGFRRPQGRAYRRPLGVVGAIIPWNYPLLILSFKLPSALLAGNTLVVKPAPTTPLATLRFAELIKDVLPKGVLNFIADANDLGDHMTKHPDIRKISFTGSSATGQKVMASAAQTLKRITLELGGNDAGIVLDDVDPKKVAPGIFEGAFQNSGQVCLAIKRLYVHEFVYDELCNELVAIAKNTVVDDGSKQGTKLGPLQNKMQYEKVKALPRRRPQERQHRCRRLGDGPSRLLHRADHRTRHQGRLAAGRRGAVRTGAAADQILRRRRCDPPRQRDHLRSRRFGVVVRHRAPTRSRSRSSPAQSGSTSTSTWRRISRSAAPSSPASEPNSPRKVSPNSPSCRSSTARPRPDDKLAGSRPPTAVPFFFLEWSEPDHVRRPMRPAALVYDEHHDPDAVLREFRSRSERPRPFVRSAWCRPAPAPIPACRRCWCTAVRRCCSRGFRSEREGLQPRHWPAAECGCTCFRCDRRGRRSRDHQPLRQARTERQGPRASDRKVARCRHSRGDRGLEPALRGLDQVRRRHDREADLQPRCAGCLVAESLRAIARAAEGGPETFCEIAK